MTWSLVAINPPRSMTKPDPFNVWGLDVVASATGPAPPEVLAATVEVMLTTVGSKPRISADWLTFIVSCAALGEDRSAAVNAIARSMRERMRAAM